MKVLFWRIVGLVALLLSVPIGLSSATEKYGPLALLLLVVSSVCFACGFCLTFAQWQTCKGKALRRINR